MKKTERKIAVAVLAVMMFSALATTAYASHANLSFENVYISFADFCGIGLVGDKDNDTPLYVEIDNKNIARTYKVRALGCTITGDQRVNLTYDGTDLCAYAVCNVGVDYSIQSLIYERGYGYATVELCACGPSCDTSGKWSPDSVETHNNPNTVS